MVVYHNRSWLIREKEIPKIDFPLIMARTCQENYGKLIYTYAPRTERPCENEAPV